MFYAHWDFCAHDKQAVLPPLACQSVVEIMNFYVAEVIMLWRKGGNFSLLHFSVIVQSEHCGCVADLKSSEVVLTHLEVLCK